MGLSFSKASTDREGKKRDPVTGKLYDARRIPTKHSHSTEHVQSYIETLKNKKYK